MSFMVGVRPSAPVSRALAWHLRCVRHGRSPVQLVHSDATLGCPAPNLRGSELSQGGSSSATAVNPLAGWSHGPDLEWRRQMWLPAPTPWFARCHDVLGEYMAPRNDGDDDDHPEDPTGLLKGGALELVVQPQRQSDDPEPGQLPSDFEQQDGKHAQGVTKAHQCQDRHRHEHALDGACLQLPGPVVKE